MRTEEGVAAATAMTVNPKRFVRASNSKYLSRSRRVARWQEREKDQYAVGRSIVRCRYLCVFAGRERIIEVRIIPVERKKNLIHVGVKPLHMYVGESVSSLFNSSSVHGTVRSTLSVLSTITYNMCRVQSILAHAHVKGIQVDYAAENRHK